MAKLSKALALTEASPISPISPVEELKDTVLQRFSSIQFRDNVQSQTKSQ